MIKVILWLKLSSDKSYLVIKVKEVDIAKEVKRSDGWWGFACGDVCLSNISCVSFCLYSNSFCCMFSGPSICGNGFAFWDFLKYFWPLGFWSCQELLAEPTKTCWFVLDQSFSYKWQMFTVQVPLVTYYPRERWNRKTLPEAQRTKGIESLTWIIFLTKINLIKTFIGHQMAPLT